MGIEVKGSALLQRKFDALNDAAKGRILERSLVAGALPVQNAAKRNAPKLTGNLARSIHIGGHDDLNPDGGEFVQTTGAGVPEPEIGPHSAAVYLGTDVVYAATQEFGRDAIPAQPYLRPAFDSERASALSEIGIVLKQQIEAIL